MRDANVRFPAILLLLVMPLSGCVSSIVYTLKPLPDPSPCLTPAADKDVLVGLAVSGGGSRAALFAAGAFEALGRLRVGPERRSLLEQVSYISSVSGGSLASAYYVLKKPGKDTAVLAAGGDLTKEYQGFFAGFKDAMARDYEGPLLWRNISHLRWFNPTWAARSLAEILDQEYLGGATFRDLAQREARGDSPRFLINTTLYNDGRRLVMSTLERGSLRYDFIHDLRRRPGWEEASPEAQQIRTKWEGLQSQTPQDVKLDICHVQIAAAVTASMSFPPVIGPITFRLEHEDQYWHVGDGGLSDNSGAESLLMVMLNELQTHRARRALLIAFDSSFPFDVGGRVLDHRKEGFSLLTYDYSRIPSIMEERSLAYRTLFFRVAQQQGMLPGPVEMVMIGLRHTDAQWKDDLSDLPESCRKEGMNWKSPADVTQHLAGIVTRLWIESTCDRELVLAAAAKVVAQNAGKIKKFLEQ